MKHFLEIRRMFDTKISLVGEMRILKSLMAYFTLYKRKKKKEVVVVSVKQRFAEKSSFVFNSLNHLAL